MKGIKILGLAIFTALALTALTGVAAASVGTFKTESVPANLTGEGSEIGQLTTLATSNCESPVITATMTELEKKETLPVSVNYKYTCGANLSANGCEFILHPPLEGEGTIGSIDIGGSKCTGLTGTQKSPIRIPPQKALTATFKNEGSGSSATVKVELKAAGLKYEVLEGIYKGTYWNGTYTTGWKMSAKYGESPRGLSVGTNPMEVVDTREFNANSYPSKITGGQVESVVTKMGFIDLKCSSMTFSDPPFAPEGLAFSTEMLWLAMKTEGCKVAGLAATVTPEAGCLYTFNVSGPYAGKLDLCSLAIKINATSCKISVTSQIRPGVKFRNFGTVSAATVEATADISGLEYKIEDPLCPSKPAVGTYTNGTYKGLISLKGTGVY